MTGPYISDEETGGAGIGPAGSIPAGSYYIDEPVVSLGAALLDLELDRRVLDIELDEKIKDFNFDDK